MPIAPWLLENNPLDLMRQGAGLGLQVRSQAAQEEEAAARQALVQQQLAQQREFTVARAAEALRQHNALEQYRRAQFALGAARAEQAAETQAAAQKLRERHQNFLEKQAEVRNAPKDYGPVDKEELVPGVLAVSRRFSPGVKIVNKATGEPELTPKQELDLQLRGYNILKEQPNLEPGSPAAFASTNLLNAINRALTPSAGTGTPSRVRVRQISTGKLGWWEGGEPPAGYEVIKE